MYNKTMIPLLDIFSLYCWCQLVETRCVFGSRAEMAYDNL
jgi:hypothetical protein